MKYKLIADEDTKRLEETVNKLLADGWQPVGGVTAMRGPVHNTEGYGVHDPQVLVQALIQHETYIMGSKPQSGENAVWDGDPDSGFMK